MVTIVSLSQEQAQTEIFQLAQLLVDAVQSGASVGFLPPLSHTDALGYWKEVITAVAKGRRVLLVALEGKVIQGSVQMDLEMRENGNHRAEVMKLFVHRRARRRGLVQGAASGGGVHSTPHWAQTASDGHAQRWRSREAMRIARLHSARRSTQLRP